MKMIAKRTERFVTPEKSLMKMRIWLYSPAMIEVGVGIRYIMGFPNQIGSWAAQCREFTK